MGVKEEIKKSATSEIVKIVIQSALTLILTLVAARLPLVRDRIWPATPKVLLLGLLLGSLLINLALLPYLRRLRKREREYQERVKGLENDVKTLQGQVTPLKTRAGELNSELSEAKIKNRRLEKQLNELSPSSLEEAALKILAYLAKPDKDKYKSAIAASLELHMTTLEYHLGELESRELIRLVKALSRNRPIRTYQLTQKGREFVVRNNLIE